MKNLLKPLIGILLLTSLIYLIDIEEVVEILISTDLIKLLWAVIFGVLANIVSIIRWNMILTMMSKKYHFKWLLGIYAQGLSLNSVLPGGIIGGDVFRSYAIANTQKKGNKSVGAKSVLVDRFSGFWSVSLLSMTSGMIILIMNLNKPYQDILYYYQILLIFITISPFITRIKLKKSVIVSTKFSLHLIFNKIFDLIKLIKTASNYLSKTLWISLMTQLFAVLNFWFCLQAVQIEISLLELSFCSTFIFLSSVIPFSFAGFGPRELGAVAILSLYGFPKEALLVASVLYGLTATFQGLLGLYWYLNINLDRPTNN
jgi:glycosyltransferase 2 family protein